MANTSIKRIGLFIDGTFFLKINSYYRYHHERKSTINFKGLSKFVCEEFAKKEDTDSRYCQVTDIHWFRGRYSTSQLEKKYPDENFRLTQMSNERRIDDIFMYENIISHNYPLLVDPRTGEAEEKGINVAMSLETYEVARLKNFDVVVIIAGDSDYLPLVKKIQDSLGVPVMVLAWDFSYESTSNAGKAYKATTRTSQALIEESVYPILMDHYIDSPETKSDSRISALFNMQ